MADSAKKLLKVINEAAHSPYPTPAEAVYVTPMDGFHRKACGNCFMWVRKHNRCVILDSESRITSDFVCNYHVAGTPFRDDPQLEVEPIHSKLAGLVQVTEGTSCDNCTHYTGPKFSDGDTQGLGKCGVVRTEGRPADVHPRGCCARWSGPV